uniref:Exonuclease domain-containing protein n=1 Tax=Pavo cristatus TaxID=9049 RepID=A0A8C9F950_PAVCR
MLRSTGYFRGIDCPFLTAAGGPPCRRPYCHFRHPPVAAARCGAPGAGGTLGLERGYDPYNPELPKPSLEAEDGALADLTDMTPGILELELVNKAIEAVKNEVEREQKKYEELLETTKELRASDASLISETPVSAAVTQSDLFTSLEYNPGSYNFSNNSDYNPTPFAAAGQSSKYTLDSLRSKGSSLEYVPKAVAQTKKYSSTVTNNKYVIDDSKPSTDLEYDPLSNYSARLLSKATTKEPKGSKRGRVPSYEDSYSPSRKKLCEVPDEYEVCARFSSSEDEADAEYKSTSVSSPSKAGSESESEDGLSSKERGAVSDGFSSQGSKETAAKYGTEDLPGSQKIPPQSVLEKNAKAAKSYPGKNEQEEKVKAKNEEKNCKDKSVKVKTDGNVRKADKHKSERVDELKKEKSKGSSSGSGKSKGEDVSRGSGTEKLGGSKRESKVKTADVKNGKETSGSKTRGTKASAAEQKKEKVNPAGKGDPKKGQKQQSLSHVDLFGDESGDEDDKGKPVPSTLPDMSSDSDGDSSGSGCRSESGKTKKAKRCKLSKSSSSSSTSDDIDYSSLEKDLDFETDPMEECLRIFNESTDVKTEDKGRLGKQVTLVCASLQRPVIPTEFGAKVPTNIRQRYLNLFIDECLKFCSSSQEAFDKALAEEKVAYERSTSRNIYLNVAVNTLKKLRSLVPNSPSSTNKTSNKKVVSHEAVLGGKLAAKTSFTLNRSGSLKAEDLTGAALYRRLKEYLMTEEQLKENGYPMPHPEKPGRAVLFTAEEKKSTDSSCRICCRCGTEYMVSASGSCIRKEECVHHWGRLRKQRVPGGWETHYSCCSGAVGSAGCQVAKQHVHDGRKESLDGFVKTFEKLPTTDGYPGIFALDCEMCYTKQGLELTRVTVINSDLKVVYDTFVKPDTKVVDYNTRFSGVTEEDLENTSITLRDVQAVLLNMFSADTILIGHSLESDLFALKLIHGTVVDTAIVFPHRLGLPYKRALRTLMADYLKRIIQDNAEVCGCPEPFGMCTHVVSCHFL